MIACSRGIAGKDEGLFGGQTPVRLIRPRPVKPFMISFLNQPSLVRLMAETKLPWREGLSITSRFVWYLVLLWLILEYHKYIRISSHIATAPVHSS